MLQKHTLRLYIICLCLLASGCKESKQEQVKIESWRGKLSELRLYLSDFEKEKAAAQTYIETAEVHQVTRSTEEKARQLFNLNSYKSRIAFKIDSTRMLIKQYADSIRMGEGSSW